MGKFALIVAHPDATGVSTSHRIAKGANDALLAAGNEVRVVDLIHTPFNTGASAADFLAVPPGKFKYEANQAPDNLIPAIREQQAILEWATHVVVIGPMWYFHYPACLYSWFERVFTISWACSEDYSKKREDYVLYGKKVLFVITIGAPIGYYSHGGSITSLEAVLYSTTYSFSYCGFTIVRSQAVPPPTEEVPDQVPNAVRAIVNIDKRPVLPFKDPAKPDGLDEIEVFVQLPNLTLEQAASL
jgi:putative NADPH-quinone reductase